jgi:hypothetical protein
MFCPLAGFFTALFTTFQSHFLKPASKQDRDYMMSFESRQDFISEFCFILQKQ